MTGLPLSASKIRFWNSPQRLEGYAAGFGDIPSLDGLRALSILAVMVAHLASSRVPGGHGVFLFFIISGFLITRLLFAETDRSGRVGLVQFYIRRLLRLYPALLAYCLIVPTAYFIKDGHIDLTEPLSVLFYFSNYLVAYRDVAGIPFQIPPIKIFWSLSVEEHFYLLFPLAFIVMRTPKRVAMLALGVCIAALVLRVTTAAFYPELLGSHYLYMRTEFRIDAIAFGVLLAALCQLPAAEPWLNRLAHPAWFTAALAAGLASIVFGDEYFANVWRYDILGPAILVGMIGILFSARYALIQTALNLPIVAWVGKLSYSLYIWHLPAQVLASSLTDGAVTIALSFVLSFAAAAASFYLVERPMVALRRRFGSHARLKP